MTIPAGTSTTATLQVVDDRIDEGTETVEIRASADGYGPSDAVTVPIGDDDSAGLTVTPADLSLTEGGSGQYEVRLDSQPLHPVTITIASSNPDVEAPAPLSFTADNWNQFQAVTVTVAHDDDATDESATVTHTAESGDLNYQGIPVPSVSVSVSDDDNQPPRCDSIATRILRVADSQTVDLSGYCSDADGHDLEYSASSSDTSTVTVSVTGSSLTLTGVAVGSADIAVTVTDNPGDPQDRLSTMVEFPVTVPNGTPVCSDISVQILWVADSQTVNLSEYCSDPDGHPLAYTARSSDRSEVTVSVSGSRLTLTGVAVGSATITVTATDNPGDPQDSLSTIEEFTATVQNRDPECEVIDGQTVDAGESKPLTVSSSDADGHSLDYTASSSDTSKVTVSMTGSRLMLTGVAATANPHPRVTVTVTDGHGGSDSVEFPVTVREKPSCDLSSISDQTLFEDEERMLPLSSVFDGTYSASSSPSGIVTVSVNNSTDELTICGQSAGTATVTARVTKSGYKPDSVSFRVTVNPPPPAPEASISASSTILDDRGCTRLTWRTENAASASINQGVGTVTPTDRGSKEVCPNAKQTYTLTATGEEGADPPTDTASVTVYLQPPTASLTADPTTIFPGERTMLSWTTTNAVSGSINGEAITSSDLPSGSKQVQLNSSHAYTLSVLGRMGADPSTDTDDAYVTVVPRPDSPSIDSFGASPTTITAGDCTTLSWTTTDADSASINQGIGSVPVDGSRSSVCPDSTKLYTLTATGAEGAQPRTDTASVTVTVNPPRPSSPVITSISPSLQRPDDRVTISGNHFGTTAGSVSFGGNSVSTFSGPGYSWSNTSIGLRESRGRC